jgi:hypothetical protein
MTLKDFIGEALSEIIFGIDEAKKRLEPTGRDHWISAPIAAVGAGQAIHDTDVAVWMPDGTSVNKANLVRFDVAVHATESKKGGGGVEVAVVNVGGELSKEEAAVSRIQFDIPLIIAEHPFAAIPSAE